MLKYYMALVGLAIVVTSVLACGGPQSVKLDFSKRIHIPAVNLSEEAAIHSSFSGPLRIAIAGLLTPTETLNGYSSFLVYLEHRLGQPIKLVQRGTYAELNALMQARQVDIALVCPLPYVQGNRDFGMELVAAAMHQGEAAHYSYLVVAADSNITHLNQIRGKAFAFTDPNSNSGWLAPAYQLALKGETPESFFSRYTFASHHSESLRAVANHLVDGAAVDNIIYNYMATSAPGLVGKTRVIIRWGPYPSPPLVAHPNLDPSLKERLHKVLLTMHQSPEGQQVLRNLGLDGFAPMNDGAYDLIRTMEAQVRAMAAVRR